MDPLNGAAEGFERDGGLLGSLALSENDLGSAATFAQRRIGADKAEVHDPVPLTHAPIEFFPPAA